MTKKSRNKPLPRWNGKLKDAHLFQVTVPRDLAERIAKRAVESELSIAAYIRRILVQSDEQARVKESST